MSDNSSQRPLSARLAAVAELVPEGATVADVCSDHALLAIHLVTSGRCGRAVAVDVAEEPVRQARLNVAAAGLEGVVDVRRGDGLRELADDVDCAVIAGVGGRLLVELLERDAARASALPALVLQPNKHADRVRAWAAAAGRRIDDERLVREGGRFFEVLRTVPGAQVLDRADVLLGPVNRRVRGPVFDAFAVHTVAWMSREADALRAAGRDDAWRRRLADLDAVRTG